MIFWTNLVIFIQALLTPMSIIFVAVLVGLGLWLFHKKIAARTLFAVAFAIFVFFSYDFGTNLLLRPLENSVKTVNPLDFPHVNTVVVLGGGRQPDSGRSPTATLGKISTTRLVEGVNVLRKTGAQNLILTGKDRNYGSIAALMAQVAIDLGVEEHQIITIDNAVNTRQEAMYTAEFVRGDTIFLVSSAAHLKRAVKNFEREGVYVIPIATDYNTFPNAVKNIHHFFPSAERIVISNRAIHEHLGLFWEIFRR
jgi:uncharacterized SAM-binding protein YcdF (DUF218 family)